MVFGRYLGILVTFKWYFYLCDIWLVCGCYADIWVHIGWFGVVFGLLCGILAVFFI